MPEVPAPREVGVTVIVGQLITSVRFSLAVSPCESVAVIVMEWLPVCVGVPESSALLNAIPAGGVPVSEMVTVPCPPVVVNVTGG